MFSFNLTFSKLCVYRIFASSNVFRIKCSASRMIFYFKQCLLHGTSDIKVDLPSYPNIHETTRTSNFSRSAITMSWCMFEWSVPCDELRGEISIDIVEFILFTRWTHPCIVHTFSLNYGRLSTHCILRYNIVLEHRQVRASWLAC